MGHNTSSMGQEAIVLIMQKVLARGKGVRINFPSKGDAIAFRFRCYSARKKYRSDIAKERGIDVSTVQSEFDKLSIGIKEEDDTSWSVVMSILSLDSYNILDINEDVEVDLEEQGFGLDEDFTEALTPHD